MITPLLLLALVSASPRQQATGPDSALNACRTAKEEAAKRASVDAEKHYRALLARAPAEMALKALLARTLSECVIEHTSVWGKEDVVKESNKLFGEVLERDSTDWGARFGLAMNYYHAPGFFGWTDDAIREFEHLLAQQGSSTLFPELALPYLYLGNLYEKKDRKADARAVWQRGRKLFPNNERLRAKAEPGR